MQAIPYNQYGEEVLKTLSKGAFLTTKAGDKINTMTIGWGSIGFSWGKPIFMAMVRRSRYTYELIEKSGEFTVSFPREDLAQALKICGTQSGRDLDKIASCGLGLSTPPEIGTPFILCKGIHYVCKTLYKTEMTAENMDSAVYQMAYAANQDYHTLYFGQILAAYEI